MPRISVGVLAHNEEPRLPAMLERLREQTLLASIEGQAPEAEVVIVANGCVDSTAAVARSFIQENGLGDRFRVIEPRARAFVLLEGALRSGEAF